MTDANTQGQEKQTIIGARLKSLREKLKLSEKEAAARLHLNPRIISIIETEDLKNAPPATFMRGYVRSYARLLNVADKEIDQALDQLGINIQPAAAMSSIFLKDDSPDDNSRLMNGITYVVVFVLIILAGMWWSSYSKRPLTKFFTAETETKTTTDTKNLIPTPEQTVSTQSVQAETPTLTPPTQKTPPASIATTTSDQATEPPAPSTMLPAPTEIPAPIISANPALLEEPAAKPKRHHMAGSNHSQEDDSGIGMQLPEPGLESSENRALNQTARNDDDNELLLN